AVQAARGRRQASSVHRSAFPREGIRTTPGFAGEGEGPAFETRAGARSCRARGAGSHARVIDPGPAFRSHRPEAWRCSMAFRGAWAGLVMATLAAAGCGDDAVGAGPAD